MKVRDDMEKDYTIVIPTYSRGALLINAVEVIINDLEQLGHAYRMILVFDGGTDATKKSIRKLCQSHEQVEGLILEDNYGQQNATLAGIRAAGSGRIITMDDDLEHDVSVIPEMMRLIDGGCDIVYGISSREDRQTHRKFGTLFKEWLFRVLLHKPEGVTLTSFKCISETMADFLKKDPSKYVYISARALKCRPVIGQVEMKTLTGIDRKSGYSFGSLVGVMLRSVIYYSDMPILKAFRRKGYQYAIKETLT